MTPPVLDKLQINENTLDLMCAYYPSLRTWWDTNQETNSGRLNLSIFVNFMDLAESTLVETSTWHHGTNIEKILANLLPSDVDFVKLLGISYYLETFDPTSQTIESSADDIENCYLFVKSLIEAEAPEVSYE